MQQLKAGPTEDRRDTAAQSIVSTVQKTAETLVMTKPYLPEFLER